MFIEAAWLKSKKEKSRTKIELGPVVKTLAPMPAIGTNTINESGKQQLIERPSTIA